MFSPSCRLWQVPLGTPGKSSMLVFPICAEASGAQKMSRGRRKKEKGRFMRSVGNLKHGAGLACGGSQSNGETYSHRYRRNRRMRGRGRRDTSRSTRQVRSEAQPTKLDAACCG